MNTSKIESLLLLHGVKPTSNRLLVYRSLSEAAWPMNLAELERANSFTLDKSSIFRAVTLFAEHGLVHAIDDGSGTVRYETCRGENGHSASDMHAHFHCLRCGKTICLEDTAVPVLPVPEGYELTGVNYMMKGICSDCR